MSIIDCLIAHRLSNCLNTGVLAKKDGSNNLVVFDCTFLSSIYACYVT